MEKEDICHLSIGRGGVISPYSGRERCPSENDSEILVRRIREALKSWKKIRLGIKLGSIDFDRFQLQYFQKVALLMTAG